MFHSSISITKQKSLISEEYLSSYVMYGYKVSLHNSKLDFRFNNYSYSISLYILILMYNIIKLDEKSLFRKFGNPKN